jgi:hypothetical protein
LDFIYRLIMARSPSEKEAAELRSTLKDLTAHYKSQPGAAKQLLALGKTGPGTQEEPALVAAWTMVASVILNLDEAITKG